MTFDTGPTFRTIARSARRPPRRLVVFTVGTAILATGCTSSHQAARSSSSLSSALSSAPISGSPAPSGSNSTGAASATSSASSGASSDAGHVASVAPTQLAANIEAPATKAGFQIRLHRGLIIKINTPTASGSQAITFTLSPATSKALSPIPDANGYYTGAADGVVTVQASQGGAVVGTIAVTVWG